MGGDLPGTRRRAGLESVAGATHEGQRAGSYESGGLLGTGSFGVGGISGRWLTVPGLALVLTLSPILIWGLDLVCPREERGWREKLLLLFSGQEKLRNHLDRVLCCDLNKRAQGSLPAFLEVLQVRTCLHPPSLPLGVLGPFLSTWPGEGGWLTGGGALEQQGWAARWRGAPGIEASESEGRQGRAAGRIFWGGVSSWNVSTPRLAWASGRTCTGTAVWGHLRERVEPYRGEGCSAQEEERPPACVVVVEGGTRWRVQGREAWQDGGCGRGSEGLGGDVCSVPPAEWHRCWGGLCMPAPPARTVSGTLRGDTVSWGPLAV